MRSVSESRNSRSRALRPGRWNAWSLKDDRFYVSVVFSKAASKQKLYTAEIEAHGSGSRSSTFAGRLRKAMYNLAKAMGKIAATGQL